MAHITSLYQTWKPEIDAYIQDEESQTPTPSYKKIFAETTTDRLQINDVTWSGFGPMVEVSELGDAVEDENKEGYKTSFSRRYFRKKAVFSKPLLDTDQTGQVEQMTRDLVRARSYSRELFVWSVFRRAFDTTLTLGDGKPLVSTLHPRKDGGAVQINTFADGVQRPLSYDNALDLQDQLLALVSNSGNMLGVGAVNKNKVIVVPPTLREEAFQIAGVEGPDKEPDTAENNMNYFRKGDKFDVMVCDWIKYEAAYQAGETSVAKTSTSNYWDSVWFIVDSTIASRYMKVFVGEGYPSFDDKVNEENESIIKYAYDAFTFGAITFYPVVGSKGDNSAYSS